MGPKSVSILEGILEPEKKNINFDSVGEDGAKIREHLGGDHKTEKKAEKIYSVERDGPKIRENFWRGILKPKRKQKKNPTRLGRMGPKSVRMFGRVLEPKRKQKKIEIEPVGKERTQNP